MQKTKLKLTLLLAILFIAALAAGIISLLRTPVSAEETSDGYYYSQLTSTESKAIYTALADMRDSGALQTGTATWDMVEKGYLTNKEYDQTTLTAAFAAGRDAFMLDNAQLFYVDFDKISVRSLTDGTNYKITLGIGRDDTYLADGFTAATVSSAITAFDSKVSAIVQKASAKVGYYDKILCAYEEIMDSAIYALEFDAGEEYADYVRCAYGVLVKGKGVCQAFSQALKTVLDKVGITSVVVQGTYIDDEGTGQPHMWLHVLMDDNRWYILDATMDNAWRDNTVNGDENSLRYFLLNGSNAAGLYAPDGVISTSGFEFSYPSLAMVDYTQPSGKFAIETATDSYGREYYNVSYNGMGLVAAEAQGYYLLFTYNVTTETGWMYVKDYLNFYYGESVISRYDTDTYFNSTPIGTNTSYIFAVTTDAPGETTLTNNFYYSGNNIVDKSSAVVYDETTVPPYVTTVSPDALRFYIGSSYTVTLTFNDDLELTDGATAVTVTYTVPEGVTLSNADSVITNVKWSESTPSQVTFTFTPDKNYSADRCGYTITVGNVVGATSGKEPVSTILTALYKPSFSCPLDPLSYCTAVATVPQLIADSDLSADGWTYTDSNGNEQTVSGSSLSNKISLVATTYSAEDNAECESAVDSYNSTNGNDVNILSSATYDLSLNLCDMQVKGLNGNKVKVLVPFPEGYSAASAGVSFKAYHFADDGSVEEIECYCTEYGIVLFCSSFSPYTVAAVEGENSDSKTVFITAEGGGSVSGSSLVTVTSGGKLTFTATADSGYCVDSITINGETISVNGATVYELEREYAELNANTTVIVKFASEAVVKAELSSGYTLAGATVAEDGGSSNTLVIALIAIGVVVVVAAVSVGIVVAISKRKKQK